MSETAETKGRFLPYGRFDHVAVESRRLAAHGIIQYLNDFLLLLFFPSVTC